MKKFAYLLGVLVLALTLTGCGGADADLTTAEFEQALNDGENVDGLTVAVEVVAIEPNSAFGYNMQAGDHLNFVSYENPQAEEGDIVVVRVEKVASMFGSYLITYQTVE